MKSFQVFYYSTSKSPSIPTASILLLALKGEESVAVSTRLDSLLYGSNKVSLVIKVSVTALSFVIVIVANVV